VRAAERARAGRDDEEEGARALGSLGRAAPVGLVAATTASTGGGGGGGGGVEGRRRCAGKVGAAGGARRRGDDGGDGGDHVAVGGRPGSFLEVPSSVSLLPSPAAGAAAPPCRSILPFGDIAASSSSCMTAYVTAAFSVRLSGAVARRFFFWLKMPSKTETTHSMDLGTG